MKDYKASLRDVQRMMADLRLGKVKGTEEEAAVSYLFSSTVVAY